MHLGSNKWFIIIIMYTGDLCTALVKEAVVSTVDYVAV